MSGLQMPRYKCHKVVRAAHIDGVDQIDGRVSVVWTEPASERPPSEGLVSAVFNPGRAWFDKHKPAAGMYLVQYEDGYLSVSPREAFEAGYTPAA